MARHLRLAALLPACALVMACGAAPADEVVVLMGGDVHGEAPIADVLDAGGDPFTGVRDHLRDADVVVVNLETPVGRQGGPPADKDILFRADPRLLDRAARAGVDVVNLANNHALDHGPEVLAATVAAAQERALAVVGVGPDEAAAWRPHLVEVAGRTVAVLGMTDVVPAGWEATGEGWGVASALDHDRAAEAVRAAAQAADMVVVTVHWGLEFRECPSVVQTELAARLADAGADVVAGHHPHVVQGIEERAAASGTAVVAYSLGNLAFYAASPETRDGALLRVTWDADGARTHDLAPVVLDAYGRPHRASPEAADRILERIRVRSRGGGTCPANVWEGLSGVTR